MPIALLCFVTFWLHGLYDVRLQTNGLISVADAKGAKVRYTQNAAGDLVAVTNRVNQTTRVDYDARHFLVSLTDALGRKQLAANYDGEGRLTSTADAQGRTVSMVHDLANRREEVTDLRGTKTVVLYDNYGNATQTMRELKDQNGVFVRWIIGKSTYDTNGPNPDARSVE